MRAARHANAPKALRTSGWVEAVGVILGTVLALTACLPWLLN